MDNYKVMVSNIATCNNFLQVILAVVCDVDKVIPEVKFVFTRGNEQRRMPSILKSDVIREKDSKKVLTYSCLFALNNIFTTCNDKDIHIQIDFDSCYGYYENVEFAISEAVASKIESDKLSKNYIGGSIFDGCNQFGQGDKLEPNQLSDVGEINEEYIYTCYAEPESKRLTVKSEKNANVKSSNKFLLKLAEWLVFLTSAFACIFLIPYFVVDSFFAAVGVLPKHGPVRNGNFIRVFIGQVKENIVSFMIYTFKSRDKVANIRRSMLSRYYKKMCKKPVVQNRVAFISGRRDELGGNEKYVYDLIKDRKDIDFQFLMNRKLDINSSSKERKKFYKLFATSKVVIVDDYFNLLYTVKKRDDVTLFQLWHACGAFKTFGFSRLGKKDGPKQNTKSHRNYDFATVSSESVVKYYAEGFGVSDSNIIPTGIPRTDIFANEEYANRVKTDFYQKYPQLKDKKILLFAPTFRGFGQRYAYYPTSAFNPNEFYENTKGEYIIILKMHPFCKERFEIDEKYKDFIIDLSKEDELNDLLFVTDLLVTDYSSAIFEASLLNIPMLFYAYDLYQYIADRGFYSNFETFVPGKIAYSVKDMENAVLNNDFESEKIEPFRKKFFTDYDGNATQKVADAILNALEK